MSIANALFPDGLPADLKSWGIVMPLAARNTLVSLQDMHNFQRHRVDPAPLTDGRWVVMADVFSETTPTGLFPGVGLITPEMLDGVSVAPWADVQPLLVSEEAP